MAPGVVNLPEHYSGDTWPGIESITFDNLVLTGAVISMQVRHPTTRRVIFSASSNNSPSGIQIITATAPSEIRVLPAIIEAEASLSYLWDLQILFNDGSKRTLLKGTLPITLDVTAP